MKWNQQRSFFLLFEIFLFFNVQAQKELEEDKNWKLVWSDEFEQEGKLNDSIWNYENGFVRNLEDQWYQMDNAYCRDGVLVIEARCEKFSNPWYEAGSQDWKKNREYIHYTSSSVNTFGKKEFLYGRFEIKARIPVTGGAWPAIWTLGREMEWPSCGEIDIMEYYQIKAIPHILANVAWGTDKRWEAHWNSQAIPYDHFLQKDPDWAKKFHIWRMDWEKDAIRLYLDDELLNEIRLENTNNADLGNYQNPFRQPHYLLLNLAVGGINGGTPNEQAFPLRYEIEYVRFFQKLKAKSYKLEAKSYKLEAK